LAVGSASERASAQERETAAFEFGARTGYAVPLGAAEANEGDNIDTLAQGQVPIWLDAGVRLARDYFVGVDASYGVGVLAPFLRSTCDTDAAYGTKTHCSARDVRLGLEFIYHPRVRSAFEPWLGAGLGWEWLSVTDSANFQGANPSVTRDYDGPELFLLQGGVDYMLRRGLGVGLFVAVSADMYRSASLSCADTCNTFAVGSRKVDGSTTHEWLFGGARVTFMP